MHVFLRTLDGRSRVIEVLPEATVSSLRRQIQASEHVPACEQVLVAEGRLLHDSATLSDSGICKDSTIHLLLRLCGGKGGFGALLRGQGRDGKITDNYDACRDLSGRRIRHVEAEKKLKEWQAEAKERELEKVALQHMKEMAKQAKRQQDHEVNVEQVRQEQRKAAEAVQDAIQSALAAAHAGGEANAVAVDTASGKGAVAAVGSKRKTEEEATASGKEGSPAKRAKPTMLQMLEGDDDDDDDDDDSDDEVA